MTRTLTEAPEVEERQSVAKRLAGYLFALACLLWVFHDLHPRQLLATIRVSHWSFVAASIVFDVLTYVLQGMRWQLLLRPVGRIRTLLATQAIYAGLFTNEVVPLRFGELVRAYLASRTLGARLSAVLPSMLVERFLDALWLAAGVGIAAIFVPLPRNLTEAGDILGVIVLAAASGLVWIIVRRERQLEHETVTTAPTETPRQSRSVNRLVRQLAAGVRDIGLSRQLYGAAVLSAGMLACQGLAGWYMMLACGMSVSLPAAMAVTLIVRLGTALPNAPANVGTFQFFTVVGLGLFGIDKTTATAFSILDFAVLTLPLWLLGLLSITQTGMTLSRIRAEIAALRK